MKPRIYRFNGNWACEDDEGTAVGLGDTPTEAYTDYLCDGGGNCTLTHLANMIAASKGPTILERLRKLVA